MPRSRAAAVLIASLLLGLLAAAACRKAPVASPAGRSAAAGAPLDLAAFVPADTAFAMFVERPMFDHPFSATTDGEVRARVSDLMAKAAMEEAKTPGARFFREIARSLGPVEATALARFGWRSGKSEAALYTVGLVPVLRLHVDGPKLEGLIRHAARVAGVDVKDARWRDRPYLAITVDADSGATAVIAVAPDQVVVAVAGQPESILDHVTTFAPPPGPSLATAWDIGDAGRFLYVDPARLGALLADRGALAQLLGKEELPEASCMAAVAQVIAAMPRTTSAIEVTARSIAWYMALDLSAETAALLGARALPGWTTERDVPSVRFGFGAAPYPLLMRTEGFLDTVENADTACGEDPSGGGLRSLLGTMGPLRAVQAFTFEMVALDRREVTMSVAVTVNDLPALWTLLAAAVPPLGATVPAIGETRDLAGMGVPATLGVGRDLLVGSVGAGHARRVRALLAAPPGPRSVLLGRVDAHFVEDMQAGKYVFMGEPFEPDDDSSSAWRDQDTIIDARLEGNQLILRSTVDSTK